MTTEVHLTNNQMAAARGHVASMSSSAAKTIIALQTHAQKAREDGNDAARRRLLAKSHEVADEMAAIHDAYARLRVRRSLNADIKELTKLAKRAKHDAERATALAEALDAAGQIIGLLTRLANLVA